MNADGSNVRQITNEPGYDGGPFISPDGKWVVYRTDRKQTEMLQIHCIGIDGKNDVALTDNMGVNWAPYWHPTEALHHLDRRRPFRSDEAAQLRPVADEVRRCATASWRGQATSMRITDHPTADVLPVFSPDGKHLMWTSNRTSDHSSQLWAADFRLPEN